MTLHHISEAREAAFRNAPGRLWAMSDTQGPTTTRPVRYGWITGVKPEKVEYYKQLHANPWPGVLRQIAASNIRNYSIYLREIDGRFFLFSYFEYIGLDFDEDMRKMEADPDTQRWWRETGPCQIPLQDAAHDGKVWADLEEVFHAD
jgi:L-rhamnose mutarotase